MQISKICLKIIVLILVFCCAALGAALADTTEILPVRSVPDLPKVQADGTPASDFHGGGTIQRIGKDETGRKLIVIDDRLRYFAKGVSFYSKTGSLLAESKFKVGTVVGYHLNAQKEIVRLYMAYQ